MKKYDLSKFNQEIQQSVSSFLGLSIRESRVFVSDVYVSLHLILVSMLRTNDQCEHPDHLLGMEAMSILCGKLTGAEEFRDMVQVLGSLKGKRNQASRQEMLAEMLRIVKGCRELIALMEKRS